MALAQLKVVVVGDGGVGKSCFLISWTTNSFPGEYVPTVFDNYGSTAMVDGRPIGVSLWDTAGQEDYDRLRPLSYPQTDVFLVCFSVSSTTSFENVQHKWVPEVRHYCPDVPLVLVGMKGDLREGGVQESERERERKPMVGESDAQQMAKQIGAVGYFETSALLGVGLADAMHAAMRAGLNPRNTSRAGWRRRFVWPWKRRSRGSDIIQSPSEPSVPPPPELPPNTKAPWITIPTSTFPQDWSKLINSDSHADVLFHLGSEHYHAHRLVLCSASAVFRRVFGVETKLKVPSLTDCPGWSKRRLQKVSPSSINAGAVDGFLSVLSKINNESNELTEITLDHKLIGELPFKRCLQFVYTGVVELDKDSELLNETITVAQMFNLPELQLICENAKKGDEFLNPSIGTWLNDRNSAVSKELFLNKQLFSDVKFCVEGEKVYAHRLVLCTRCDVMAAMLTGGFMESGISEIEIPDVSLENFLALLEYLYTDHAPIEEGDSVGILELSNKYVLPRLMALCELYISKEVERATAESITQADVDVVGLLLTSQFHNAQQLSAWCLHFISSNYLVYESKEEFSLITGDNLAHVREHQWPPISYFKAMEEYKKEYGGEEERKEGEGEVEEEIVPVRKTQKSLGAQLLRFIRMGRGRTVT